MVPKVHGRFKLITGRTFVRKVVCKKVSSPGNPNPPSAPPPETPYQRCVRVGKARAPRESWPVIEKLCWGQTHKAKPSKAELETLAQALVVQLRLPDTSPHFGPDPHGNEWDMLAVGYPIWLWVDGPGRRSATAAAEGFTFTLSARRVSTTFNMGDGRSLTCPTTTPYPRTVAPGTPSPTCGYVYQRPSLPQGDYQVTATAHWQISWSASGMSGAFPHSYSDSGELPVGELQALIR